ncbi:hypothetical protein HMPREF0290_2733 [Corynebacterium efficiens YS-314]|nr:hypothetical protein HMPREF0290_2733 [Corynebacterium efficiens YS-314]
MPAWELFDAPLPTHRGGRARPEFPQGLDTAIDLRVTMKTAE